MQQLCEGKFWRFLEKLFMIYLCNFKLVLWIISSYFILCCFVLKSSCFYAKIAVFFFSFFKMQLKRHQTNNIKLKLHIIKKSTILFFIFFLSQIACTFISLLYHLLSSRNTQFNTLLDSSLSKHKSSFLCTYLPEIIQSFSYIFIFHFYFNKIIHY